MKFLIALFFIPQFVLAAPTCKIKTVNYAGDWLSSEMKAAFTEKGYTLSGPYDEAEVDYVLNYELKTYGIYPCRIAAFTCTGSKQFANLDLTKVGEQKPLIELEASSKTKTWEELRQIVEASFMKKISKLTNCK